jgi:hypothetical protein
VTLLLLVQAALAAQVALQLDADELREGQTVALSLVVVDAAPRGVPTVVVPNGLKVAFESQARQSQIINFQATSSTTLTYALTALTAGEYAIPAVTVPTDAGTLTTAPLTVRVEPRAPGGLETLTADIGTAAAWVGQVLVYDLSFQTDNKVVNGRWSPPEAPGFMAEPTVEPFTREYGVEQDGKPLSRMELAYPLRAMKPGEWTIPGGVLQAQYAVADARKRRRPDSHFLDGIGAFGNVRTEVHSSAPLTVKIKELPSEGRPKDGSSLVGRFTIAAKPSATEARVGDTVTVEVTVTGDGVLAGYTLPPLAGDTFRVYDDQPVVDARLEGGAYVARASFKRAIVPQAPGRIEVPAIELGFFDPSAGAWTTVRTQPIGLDVAGEAAKAEVQPFDGGVSARTVEAIGEDILPVRTDPELKAPLPRALAVLLVLPGLSLLAVQGLGAVSRRRARAPAAEHVGFDNLPAEPEARLAAIEQLYRARVGARLGIAAAALRREDLAGLGERAPEAEALYRALERCRYGDARDVPEARVRAFVEDL